MRMWGVPPKFLCRKHLLGEHLEMHMFAGSLKKRKQIKGYVAKGLVETRAIKKRHDELAREMRKRGYKHESPLEKFRVARQGFVNAEKNLRELARRCSECRKLQAKS